MIIQHHQLPIAWNRTVSALSWYKVWGIGWPSKTFPKDPGICQGSPVLGRESPAADARCVLPTGREHMGTLMSHGTSDLVHWCWGSGWQPSIQLDQDHVLMDIGAHRYHTYSGRKPQSELWGPGQRHICSDPGCRVIKADSHCLSSESISLTSPEGRATARGYC